MDDVIANNRRFVRQSLKSRVTLVMPGDRRHLGTLVDVSQEGFGITGYKPMDTGQTYDLALMHLPREHDAQRIVELRAECMWFRQINAANFASGFAIREASGAAQQLLASLLQANE